MRPSGSSSSPTPDIAPRDATAAQPSDELTYVVAGMTCGHCKVAVTQEVGQVSGVQSVDVDLDSKLVRIHGADLDDAAVRAAIDEAGYEAVAA
jgi:copper chaperone CopZ